MKPTSPIHEILWWGASLGVTLVLVGLWQVVADMRLISPVFLPGPDRAVEALRRWYDSGVLFDAVGGTVWRIALGWLLASALGIIAGSLIGISTTARTLLSPTLEFLRPIPASAIMPVAMLFLGLTEQMVLATIAFGAVWPVLLATVLGFRTTEPRLLEVSRMLGLNRLQVIWSIVLPGAIPAIVTSLRLTLTISLVLTVIGEMIASRPGLGQLIIEAARGFRSPEVFAGIMLLGFIGLISNLGIRYLEARLVNWR